MNMNLYNKGNAPQETQLAIKELLRKLQNGYTNRNINIIDNFVSELFVSDEDSLIIGTADSEWHIGQEEIKNIIKSDWQNWGDVSIDTDSAMISSEGNTSWFYVKAVVKNKPGTVEEKYLNNLLNKIKSTCNLNDSPREKVFKIMEDASLALLQLENGAEFVWPFRLCGIAVLDNDVWKFHQLQFSFPTVMPPDVRYNDISKYEKKALLQDLASNTDKEDVRNVLAKFQVGYSSRDVGIIDQFINELFAKDEDVFIVGTGSDELCYGISDVKELIEGDWLYWGNVKLFVDNAMISSNGDTAWLATDALLTKTMSEKQFSDGLINTISEDIQSDMSNRGKLLHTLQGISHVLYHAYQGEEYIRPFRFTAVLVKRDGIWKFKQMHFSHPTITTPDVRLIDGKAYYGLSEL